MILTKEELRALPYSLEKNRIIKNGVKTNRCIIPFGAEL